MATDASARVRRITGFLGPALAALAVIGYLLYLILTGIPGQDFISAGLAINHGPHAAKLPPTVMCVTFIVLNIVRIWLGLTFLHSDVSFRKEVEAMRNADQAGKETIEKIENKHVFVTVLLYILFVLFGVASRGMLGIWGLVVIFLLQALSLMYIDYIWWKILISRDVEKAANKFIVIGDGIVLIFSVILLFCAIAMSVGNPVDSHWESALFIAMFGALFAVFIGECWSQYWGALVARCKEVFSG